MIQPRLGAVQCPLEGGGGVSLRWHEWGPVTGRPVVCVHGLTRTGRDFDTLAMALAAQGRRVICPDVPGRGLSGWLPSGSLYVVPTYVAALLPLLSALDDYDWVGTSMGGLIGMGICAIPGNRLRRLVLNDIGPFIEQAALERIRDYLQDAPQTFPGLAALEAHLRRIHAPFGALTDPQWAHLAATSARMTANGELRLHYDPAILQAMQGTLADVDLWALWDLCVQRPVLALRGETSDLLSHATLDRMGSHPDVTVATIPGCGHAPALMAPAQIALVTGFLAG